VAFEAKGFVGPAAFKVDWPWCCSLSLKHCPVHRVWQLLQAYYMDTSSVKYPANMTCDGAKWPFSVRLINFLYIFQDLTDWFFPLPTSSSMKSKWEATPHDYLQVVLNLSLLIGLPTANIQRLHQQLLLIQHSLKDKWRRSWSIVKEKKAKKN